MNRTEHLLTCLIEECAEIQKAAAKALRFGLDDHAPGDTATNAEDIADELLDLAAVMEMLEQEGIIPKPGAGKSTQRKKDKVEKYIKYARGRGTVSDEQPCRRPDV